MRASLPRHLRTFGLCAAVLLSQTDGRAIGRQSYDSSEAQLLGKARTLEARGHIDLATSVWKQVLLIDPKNTEALGGLARAARQEGHPLEAAGYLNQLRAINPKDPNVTGAPSTPAAQGAAGQLAEAQRLAHSGEPDKAMGIYRQLFGTAPPAGEVAISYYETEAATDDGRPHAIAGLRALNDRVPSDPRYAIALGRILTYNPRTRGEGRKLLERFPSSPVAMAALREAMDWDATSAGNTVARASVPPVGSVVSPQTPTTQVPQPSRTTAPSVAQVAPPARIPVPSTSSVRSTPSSVAQVTPPPRPPASSVAQATPPPRPQPSPVIPSPAPTSVAQSRPAEPRPEISFPATTSQPGLQRVTAGNDAAGYRALKARRFFEAEGRFRSLLQRNPRDAQAMAGLGYAQMGEGNAAAAAGTLERARAAGASGYVLDRALSDVRFQLQLQDAIAALSRNDIVDAQKRFTAALQQRPADPGALQGLGTTLLKAQQGVAATKVFSEYTQLRPSDPAGWRGLLMAQVASERYTDAARTQARMPATLRRDLAHDPAYLRAVLILDAATGNVTDAPWLLNATLDLPFPAGGRGLKPEVQLQYAALLGTTGLKGQAAALYRQVLNAEPSNVDAWVGLITLEHDAGQDAAAYAAIHALSPAIYGQAIMDPAFVTTEASIDESQDHSAAARASLEALLARQKSQGNLPFGPAQIALADLYRNNGESARAYPLYRSVLMDDPQRVDAWTGLITTLHATGHDPEALAQWQQIQPTVRTALETDPAVLQTLGLVYVAADQPDAAFREFTRVQQHYASLHRPTPPELEIELAQVLYRLRRDADLYRQLLALGSRGDLTDAQRLATQTVWADWAVRKADAASAAGTPIRGAALLTAASDAFPHNPTVVRAVQDSYAPSGVAIRALSTVRTQNTMTTSVQEFKALITAALATHDLKSAENWVHVALIRYPKDAEILELAGKYEMARGHSKHGLEFFRESLAASAPPDPGTELVRQLGQPTGQIAPAPPSGEREALAALLAEPSATLAPTTSAALAHPYLPSYAGRQTSTEQAHVRPAETRSVSSVSSGLSQGLSFSFYAVPGLGSWQLNQDAASGSGPRLRDFVPQSQLELPKGLPAPPHPKSGA